MAEIEVLALDHVDLTVRDLARSTAFYDKLLPAIGMRRVAHDGYVAWGNGHMNVGLRAAATEHRDTPFEQTRIGLHHFCFRLRSREDVDTLHAAMRDFGAKIIRAPEIGPWAPEYYSVLFEDPDGIRIEGVFIPGAGNLDRIKDAPLTPAS